VLISGGAYWRIALVPVFVPAFRDNPRVVAMLTHIGLQDSPDWVFYLIALGGAVVILAIRVAWLEISRVTIDGIDTEYLDGVCYLRLRLKNNSFKNVDNLRVALINSTPDLSFTEQPTSLPLILVTQQRLQRQRAGIEKVPQRRFSIGAWETKWVEIFSTMNGLEAKIEHENGECKIRLFLDYMLLLEISGGGGRLECNVFIISGDEGQGWKPFLIKDAADEYVFSELGLRGWW
jgi:hypothetical protein